MGRINRKLKGWSNYFRLGTVSKAYRNVDSHVRHRVGQWLCVKFKVQGHGRKWFHAEHLYQELGLHRLQRNVAPIVRGRTCDEEYQYSLVRKPGCRKTATPGLMSGMWKTESWRG